MLKKFIGYALFGFFIVSNVIAHAFDGDQTRESSLESVGRNYQDFLNFAGNDALDCASIEAETFSLFASNFRKVVNNQIACEGRDKIGSYLWEFRENLGRWKIKPDVYPLITSADGFSYVTVIYTVGTIDKAEAMSLVVIAILKVDIDKKIVEVFEVDHSILH
ncbi:MAG: hypothetical protein V4494_05495 [Chlamydiota bacterium]